MPPPTESARLEADRVRHACPPWRGGSSQTATGVVQAVVTGEPVRLMRDQRELIECVLPGICERGKWTYHTCAAPHPDDDHFHVLLDADPAVHGKEIRKWLKRWLTEQLDQRFGRPMGGAPRWWVDGGSTKPVKDAAYFENALEYIRRQRTTVAD